MLRDNGNVTFKRRRVQKPYLPSPDFAENRYQYETRDTPLALCWLALGACAISF